MRSRTRRASRRSVLLRWAAGVDAVSRRDVVCCATPPRPALRCAAIMRADSLLRPSRRATRVARGESSSASATARTPRWPGALRLSGCRHALTTMPEPASGARGRSRRGPPQRRLRRRRDDVPAGDTRRAHTYTPTSTNANTRTCRLAHCALPRLILCGERARQPRVAPWTLAAGGTNHSSGQVTLIALTTHSRAVTAAARTSMSSAARTFGSGSPSGTKSMATPLMQ